MSAASKRILLDVCYWRYVCLRHWRKPNCSRRARARSHEHKLTRDALSFFLSFSSSTRATNENNDRNCQICYIFLFESTLHICESLKILLCLENFVLLSVCV